ncbi:hypothetical protein SAMN04487969_113164 [Paenibacillus algorifonticola]|uniref:Uncharacterized protein n=1 Tax=Paenibacillus algorifonticola TaxID=684063 RepID=A0A1I2FV29_9BACL|nr:hypothetical protein [Paenibacillus algorifonticola]SFF09205.1 hypothetical protein SAMN04487969_113164 [Paenibacillus algorifonticola]
MNAARAKEIISLLSDGIDPITGEIYHNDSPYQQPEVIRALYTALKGIELLEKRENKELIVPSKSGKSWSEEEDEKLVRDFDQGESIKKLSIINERTEGAIKSRLTRLGRLQMKL